MKIKEKWNQFFKAPFSFFDNTEIKFLGLNWNLFRDSSKLRNVIGIFATILLGVWVIMGFDSGVGQLEYPIFSLPKLFTNQMSFKEWLSLPSFYYGKTMHFSAFVIYGYFFYFLSKHYEEKHKVRNSKNIAFTLCCMLFTIAVFEYYWIYSYANFQNQGWVAKWTYPQVKILVQNLVFTIVGLYGLLYIHADYFSLNYNWKTLFLFLSLVSSMIFWIYYPLHVEPLTVELSTGVWSNTNRFPQTLYTIDLDPLDTVNSGEWFYVKNDLIHGVNTGVKSLMTYFFYYLFKLKKLVKP